MVIRAAVVVVYCRKNKESEVNDFDETQLALPDSMQTNIIMLMLCVVIV